MKIKLDENLPSSLVSALAAHGHGVSTVPEEGLQGAPDQKVWSAAQTEGRFLITQDLHFADVRTFAPGTHGGVLIVRLSMPGRKALFERILSVFMAEDVESWVGSFVVVSEYKIRVRRPK